MRSMTYAGENADLPPNDFVVLAVVELGQHGSDFVAAARVEGSRRCVLRAARGFDVDVTTSSLHDLPLGFAE